MCVQLNGYRSQPNGVFDMENEPNNFFEMFPQEPLIDELKPYLFQMPIGGGKSWTILKHPLVFAVPYSEVLNANYNKQYTCKVELLQKSIEEKRWSTYVFTHERPHRFDALLEITIDHADDITPDDFWKVLANCWSDTENMWEMRYSILRLINLGKNKYASGIKSFMSQEEQNLFDTLPDQLIVYRGHQVRNRLGMSWTLSRCKAHWFAKRFKQKGFVAKGIVNKSDILGVLIHRGELEIAVLPEYVTLKRYTSLRRSAELRQIHRLAVAEFKLGLDSIHGPNHWEDVERKVMAIAKESCADMMVCRLFAILHDCKRENEHKDDLHGTRSSRFIKELYEQGKLPINESQLEKLMIACVNHTKGFTTNDPTIGSCWDADRMDLVRVGKIPDFEFFSTYAAKRLMWKI